jgi:hypothetical protein
MRRTSSVASAAADSRPLKLLTRRRVTSVSLLLPPLHLRNLVVLIHAAFEA